MAHRVANDPARTTASDLTDSSRNLVEWRRFHLADEWLSQPGWARLSAVDLAAIAAFSAAGLSLVNVVVSYRFASRGSLEQWRRDEQRPVVARMLTLSDEALSKWRAAGFARREWLESLQADPGRSQEDTQSRDLAAEHWSGGSELYDKLRFELAQLDLIAGRPLRDVAARLVREHESARQRVRPASGGDDWFRPLMEQNNTINGLHADLVMKTRADLGLGQDLTRRRLRSLLRRFP